MAQRIRHRILYAGAVAARWYGGESAASSIIADELRLPGESPPGSGDRTARRLDLRMLRSVFFGTRYVICREPAFGELGCESSPCFAPGLLDLHVARIDSITFCAYLPS